MLIKEYDSIIQQLNIANKNLLGLVSARERFQLQIAQSTFPWKVISEPQITNKPVSPSYRKFLTLGLVGGIFLGILSAILKDRFDYVFHDINEILDELKVPLVKIRWGHILMPKPMVSSGLK